MAVAFAGAAQDAATSTSDTSLVATAPAGSGGLLLAFLSCDNSRTATPPAGWTTQVTFAATNNTLYLFTLNDDAAGSYTFTVSGSFNNASVAVCRLTGGTLTGILTSTATASGSHPTQAATDITTTAANSMLVWFGRGVNGLTCTTSGSQTEQYDYAGGVSGCSLVCYTETRAVAGTGTPPTLTWSGYNFTGIIGVAIAPSAAAGSTALNQPPYPSLTTSPTKPVASGWMRCVESIKRALGLAGTASRPVLRPSWSAGSRMSRRSLISTLGVGPCSDRELLRRADLQLQASGYATDRSTRSYASMA